MYLIRLKKYSRREIEQATSTMRGEEEVLRKEILKDYARE
jgi:hypothetical protein